MAGTKKLARTSYLFSRDSTRGTPARDPYWPCDKRPTEVPPSRSSNVS